ncbi:hypothetical protein [Roseivirga sp.]|uniref:hypothetical protein n=1 Tax=Roseivirga sp. TaxID=1964215 RepID=UPI002B2686CD|nr:hypothetical protein [Roseivirga sp.]
MKVSVSIVILISFLKISAFAQEQESLPMNYLGIGVGYSFDRIKDVNFSPLQQHGSSLFYSIFYERHAENTLKISIKYSDTILKSGRSNRFKSSTYNPSVSVTYLKNLSPEQSSNLYIGGTYELNILYMDWNGQDAFSYLSTNGLSVSAAISKQLTSEKNLESTISIPVIQFLSRPPYNGIDEYIIENQDDPLKIIFNSDLVSFKDYKSIRWNINYNHEISNRLNWKVDYDLNIQKVEKAPTFTSLSNRISTSLLYKL